MPAVRHCSVGPPRSAIHGRVAATPASLPGCSLRNTCLRPAWFNGAPEIKIKSQIKNRARAAKLHSPVGAGLPAIEISRPIHLSTDRPPSRRPPNHCWIAGTPRLGEVPSGGSPASDTRSPLVTLGLFFYGPGTWLTGVRGQGGHFWQARSPQAVGSAEIPLLANDRVGTMQLSGALRGLAHLSGARASAGNLVRVVPTEQPSIGTFDDRRLCRSGYPEDP